MERPVPSVGPCGIHPGQTRGAAARPSDQAIVMWWASTVYRFAVWVVFSLLTACASLPSSSSFPTLDPTEQNEKARIMQFRTTGLRTLAAILTVTFAGPERQGIFEMIVNYDASGK